MELDFLLFSSYISSVILGLSCLVAEDSRWVVMGFWGLRDSLPLCILMYHIFPFSDSQLYILNHLLSFGGQVNSIVLSIYLLYIYIGLLSF